VLHRQVRRAALSGLLTGSLILTGGAAPAVAAPSPKVKSVHSAAPKLAAAVMRAHSHAARVKALERVMAAFHVTAMEPRTGHVVVPGAARTAYDAPIMYTTELHEIAFALEKHRTLGLADVTNALNVGGYAKAGYLITPDQLAASVEASAHAAATSHRPDSAVLSVRLLRALSLAHKVPQDLAKQLPAAQIRLDPLQMWVLVADFTLPLLALRPAARHPAPKAAALTHTVLKETAVSAGSVADVCEKFVHLKKALGQVIFGVGGILQGWATKYLILPKPTWLPTLSKYLAIAQEFADLVHLIVNSAVVDIRPGHPVHTKLGGPGADLDVVVTMTFKLPDILIKCGPLAGQEFAAQGPIADVWVLWRDGGLTQWGTVTPSTPDLIKTDKDGRGLVHFQPKPDPVSSGPMVSEHGAATATALVNTGQLGLFGALQGLLVDATRTEGIGWTVDHHRAVPPMHLKLTLVQSQHFDGLSNDGFPGADPSPLRVDHDYKVTAEVALAQGTGADLRTLKGTGSATFTGGETRHLGCYPVPSNCPWGIGGSAGGTLDEPVQLTGTGAVAVSVPWDPDADAPTGLPQLLGDPGTETMHAHQVLLDYDEHHNVLTYVYDVDGSGTWDGLAEAQGLAQDTPGTFWQRDSLTNVWHTQVNFVDPSSASSETVTLDLVPQG
jgi:hypothetical protein